MVLDVVHDLGDTSLMVLEEGGGHNWVQAVEGYFQGFFHRKTLSCLGFNAVFLPNNVGLDDLFVEIKVLVHPANGHEHACIV